MAEEAIWLEVEESVTLEKYKQALQDSRKKKDSSTQNDVTNDTQENKNLVSEGSSRSPSPVCDESVVALPSLEGARHLTTVPLAVLPNSTPVLSSLMACHSSSRHQAMLPRVQWMNPVNPSELDIDPQSWNDDNSGNDSRKDDDDKDVDVTPWSLTSLLP